MHHQFRRKGFRKVTLQRNAHQARQHRRADHQVCDKAFTGLAETTRAARRRILDRFRDFKTPSGKRQAASGKRYGDARFSTMIKGDINAVLKGKTPTVQGIWMKTLRLITFAIDQCKKDPEERSRPTRPSGSRPTSRLRVTDTQLGRRADPPVPRALPVWQHGAACS